MGILALLVGAACLLLGTTSAASICSNPRPNIVMVLVDDLGFTDLNFDNTRDPAFYTPNIDRLNREGIRMLSTYTPPNCSPSRHCILSGLYPYRYGNQDNGISVRTTGHIPLDKTILPQKLRQYNYKSHMIGKWHEGFCEKEQTPINRGFDSWEGFYNGKEDHFKHIGKKGAYDYRRAERPDNVDPSVILDEPSVPPSETRGKYSTHLFYQRAIDIVNNHATKYGTDGCKPFFILLALAAIHGPNQVPDEYIQNTRCKDIPDISPDYNSKVKEYDGRRIKCGMMVAVDEGLKNLTDALTATGQLDNTVIAFTSDNGGSWTTGSSNYPLRGGKTTLWEGGIRVPSFIWSKSTSILPYQNRDWKGMMYQTDWYPTFVGFATKSDAPVTEATDGVNHYARLYNNDASGSSRTEFAYVNEIQDWHAVLRQGDFKLLVNQSRYPGIYNAPVGACDNPPPGVVCGEPTGNINVVQLYNIANDPYETRDLTNLPQPVADFVRPSSEAYNLDPKPAKPTEEWKARKAQYDAAVAEFFQKKAAYDAALKQWEADKAVYDAKAASMLDRLNTRYWGELWVPTVRDLKDSDPNKMGYTIPNYSPLTYAWSPGWCNNNSTDGDWSDVDE